MALTRRYQPPHPPDETCVFALDYGFILPRGVTLASCTLQIFTNTNPPQEASGDWVQEAVGISGRAVYCGLTGGTAGVDYQLRWVATDTLGNTWPRTTLVLCADTS